MTLLDEYAESVDPESHQSPAKCWYLPTHAVLKIDMLSLRIVIDCTHSYNCITLNGSCYQGPNLIWKWYDVILRLCQRHSAVIVDIALMYKSSLNTNTSRDGWLRSPVLLRTYRSECNDVSLLMISVKFFMISPNVFRY